MSNKDSKDRHHSELQLAASEDVEKNVFANANANHHPISFDQLQNEFDSLINGSSSSYEEPADAFNDLANAFSTEADPTSKRDNKLTPPVHGPFHDVKNALSAEPTAPPASAATEPSLDSVHASETHALVDDGLEPLSHLDDQLPAFESDAFEPNAFEPDAFESDLLEPNASESNKSNAPDPFQADEFQPITDSFQSESSLAGQGSGSSSDNEVPVFADLSEPNSTERPKNHTIAFTAIILIATAAGIYWYTMPSSHSVIDQATQTAVQKQPEAFTETPTKTSTVPSTSTDPTPSTNSLKESTAQQKAVKKTPTTLSTSDAIKLLTSQNHATPDKTPPHSTTQQASNSTYNGGWNIIAPMASKSVAQQYLKAFDAKHMDSDILHTQRNGKSFYFIRIKGFSSKQSALKHSAQLATSSQLKSTRIIKATTKLTSQILLPKLTTARSPITTPLVTKNVTHASKPTTIKSAHWAIVAPVSSNKAARQYVARLHAKHMRSEAIHSNNNGKTQYFIRIKGFSNKSSAEKELNKLSKIWELQNAKVQPL